MSRALLRGGRIHPGTRRRRRADYRRWERRRPMELWQMDVVGGIHLADGVEVKVMTGIDDNSRFVLCGQGGGLGNREAGVRRCWRR